MEGFRYDAHPMGMLVSVAAALSTFYPEALRWTTWTSGSRRSTG